MGRGNSTGSASERVREVLRDQPDLPTAAVLAVLSSRGIEVTADLVKQVRANLRRSKAEEQEGDWLDWWATFAESPKEWVEILTKTRDYFNDCRNRGVEPVKEELSRQIRLTPAPAPEEPAKPMSAREKLAQKQKERLAAAQGDQPTGQATGNQSSDVVGEINNLMPGFHEEMIPKYLKAGWDAGDEVTMTPDEVLRELEKSGLTEPTLDQIVTAMRKAWETNYNALARMQAATVVHLTPPTTKPPEVATPTQEPAKPMSAREKLEAKRVAEAQVEREREEKIRVANERNAREEKKGEWDAFMSEDDD